MKKRFRWKILEKAEKDNEDVIVQKLGVTSLTARFLINRGVTDPVKAEKFINPKLEDMNDPFIMKGMEMAVSRIVSGIKNREKIFIYGDYDVDGITAVSLIMVFFRDIGIDAFYYIPDRREEGYGVSIAGLRKIRENGGSLVITVDCGISSVLEVEEAKKIGLDVIITDHHHIPDNIPDAYAVINPIQPDCKYPYKSLSGVGVAYKLIKGIRARLREETWFKGVLPNLKRHLDLVAMGTIADVVPFNEENRIFVKYGLEELKKSEKIGISALKNVSGINGKAVGVYDVGFAMAPRINSSGRIANADIAVRLLISKDQDEAIQIANKLDASNKSRQSMQEGILLSVRERIAKEIDIKRSKSIVLSSADWHPGIIGIAASRILEEFYLPTILISLEGDKGKGSARSIASLNIYDAIKKVSHLIVDFGGHKMAAGLSIERKNIERFKEEFNNVVTEMTQISDFTPELVIDSKAALRDIDMKLVQEIETMRPFGPSNPHPVVMSRDVYIRDYTVFGKNGDHIKFIIVDNTSAKEIVGFNMAYLADLYDISGNRFDIVYSPELNEWNGTVKLQLKLKDMRQFRG